MEIMIWCIRHQFLENLPSRYSNLTSWRSSVRERKSAAIRRAWPNAISNSEESVRQEGSLFIEDALTNLEIEHGYAQEMGEELKVAYLQKDGISSVFRSKIEGVVGCYPFESLQAAIDILFLRGSSDMVVAKQAIVSFLILHFFLDVFLNFMKFQLQQDLSEFFSLTYDSFSITYMIGIGQRLMRNGDTS